MITEDYVSFETAKLLKEKGFDEECNSAYCFVHRSPDDKGEWDIYYNPMLFSETSIMRPTLQMAMKWLREEKGFHIFAPLEIDYDEDERGDKWYHDAAYYPEIIRVSDGKIMYDDGSLYTEPEQACEAGIKYCLENLI
ncbi:MAG: hypothetical protein J6U54_15035 [Clostridiales bacterium]|nr:hypothetical protein [Clostridiales bacterium]